jgi:hypothetical protein
VTDLIFATYDLDTGLAAGRPAAPVPAGGRLYIYMATDTGAISIWNGAAWVAVAVGIAGAAGSAGQPGFDADDALEPLMIPGQPGLPGIAGAPGIPGIPGIPGLDADEPLEPLMFPGPVGLLGATGPVGPPGLDAEEPLEALIIPGPPGSGVFNGSATVNFGAFPGNSEATVDVTGQGGLIATSKIRAWILPIATADHSADEHIIESLDVTGVYKVDGALTIKAQQRFLPQFRQVEPFYAQALRLFGQFTVAWRWAN